MKHETQVALMHKLFALRERGRQQDMLGRVVQLPVNVYSEPAILDDELQSVFKNFPMVLGHASHVQEPGSYLLSDWDKFPVVVVRDNAGTLRAFLNMCRHRGAKLVNGEEERLKAFVCPFHGWSYSLDGKLKGVTRSYNFPDLDPANCNLRELPVAEAFGLIWVHPTATASLDIRSYLGDIADDLEHFNIGELVSYKKTKVVKQANWKLLLKTYLEGYHVPYLHRTTLQAAFKNGVIAHYEHGPNIRLVAARTNIEEAMHVPESDWNILNFASVYYTLFPNTFFIMHPDYVSINMFFPIAPNQTIWTHEMLYRPADFQGKDAEKSLAKRFEFTNDVVFDGEDFAVAEGVQSGIEFAPNEVHTLGLEEGLLGMFQASVDAAIAQ